MDKVDLSLTWPKYFESTAFIIMIYECEVSDQPLVAYLSSTKENRMEGFVSHKFLYLLWKGRHAK